MDSNALSPGQVEALDDLYQVVGINAGRIRIDDIYLLEEMLGVDIAIDCRGEVPADPGLRFEDWEPVSVLVPPQFPFEHPLVMVPHQRFAGLPHVMWAHSICLYLAANDWDPARRMHGFIGQLLTWFEAVARGTITGPEIPWHAPLTFRRTGQFLMIGVDLPDSLESDHRADLAIPLVEWIGGRLYRVRQWLRSTDEALKYRHRQAPWDLGSGLEGPNPVFVAPMIMLRQPVGFAYPNSREDLLDALAAQGLSIEAYESLVEFTHVFNAGIWNGGGRAPELLLLGSPAPDRHAIPSRVAHVAAWALGSVDDPDAVSWLTVFDQRPRITTRRDTKRPVQWLVGKRVLVLGCGALGAPTAEFCVRAGADKTYLVDDGEVRPGVLVRQPYMYLDIGRNKAQALAERLAGVDPDRAILPIPADAISMITGTIEQPEVDLIIDATANRSVAAALERARWNAVHPPPPLLSMMVGHDCERGAATLALPGASGAGVDILRRLAITASAEPDLYDLLDDFFPDHPRGVPFQPEPGCSDPTYVGSAADLATFAGQLLNDALAVLTSADNAHDTAFPRRWASVVRTSEDDSRRPSRHRLSWANDLVQNDRVSPYQVRVDPAAWACMRRDVALMAERRGPNVETGGILLGQIDHASQVVWISEADGPPPGSVAYVEGLKLDPTHARARAANRRRLTRNMVAYIGAWHTHPDHAALPSPLDNKAMNDMARDGVPVLMMILGGGTDRLSRWVADDQLPDVYLQLYFPGPDEGAEVSVLGERVTS